jgi:putative transposase
MDWKTLLGSITKSVDAELRLRNAYLVAENRILRQQIRGRLQLTDSDRKVLADIGQKLGKKTLAEIATVAKPDTILAWHRTCTDRQCNRSQPPKSIGRPRIVKEIEDLVVRMARENRSWGYDRIVGALTNLGYRISDQTVGNILKRHSIPPAPERKTTVTWREFIRFHLDVLLATDFFTNAVWTWLGVVLSCMLLCLHVDRRAIYDTGTRAWHSARWRWRIVSRSFAWHTSMTRWICAVTRPEVSRLPQGSDRVRCLGLSTCTTPTSQKPFPHSRGIVVLLPVGRHCRRRDGPLRRHQRFGGLLRDANREAA